MEKRRPSERIAKKQYDDAARSASEWENRAKTALAAGDEELAKKALENKIKADKDAAAYKEMYDTISQQTETIRTQVEVLKSKLEEAKSRQAMLIARSQMAETQKNLAKSTGGFVPRARRKNSTVWKKRLFKRKPKLRLLQK